MGTHPIFESDFDCLTDSNMSRNAKQARYDQNSGQAHEPLYGANLSKLGTPFGKELTIFNFEKIFEDGDGAIQAKYNKAFGEYKMPMGVEIMSDEILICNMNNGTVEFVDFNGEEQLVLPSSSGRGPSSFKEPSVATVTLQHDQTAVMILVSDKTGLHVYDGDGNFEKTVKPKCNGTIYGVVPLRINRGCIQLICQKDSEYIFERWDKALTRCNNSFRVELPGGSDDKYTIRFSTGLGNTILLSDMNRNNQGIWNVDLNGKLRKKIGGYGEGESQFIQAAGLAFDNEGNFLAICSKTSRITAFRSDGTHMCDLQFPEGAIQRPSDLSVNDDGKLAVVSLTGQCFLFDLLPGDSSSDWPTRGPRPASGYSRGRGRGRGGGRGSGGRGRGGRGRGRGRW